MSDPEDYLVPPLRWSQIDQKANAVRSLLKLSAEPYLDIVRVVENVLCGDAVKLSEFQVWSKAEMGPAEGLTCPQGSFIRFREDVYVKACNGDYRARFTFAHELGHLILHRDAPMARASRRDGVETFRLAEPQANRFAATLLMPEAHIARGDSSREVVERFGVSWEAASFRLADLKKKGSA